MDGLGKNWRIAINSRSEGCFQNIVEAFQDAYRQAGDGLALVYQDKQFTYHQVERRSNRMARHLRALGATQGQRVGIFLNRGPELVGSILSVLKTGAAYLPLDPTYPRDRIQAMLEDAGVDIIITREDLVGCLPPTQARLLDVFHEWSHMATLSPEPLNIPINGDDIAYVIFTSGSTGRPKGVEVPHKGVLNLVAYTEQGKELSVGDRFSMWSSTNFDASVCEIFPALLTGGILHILPEALRADTDRFAKWMADLRIQAGFIPPFMLKDLLQLFSAMEEPPPFRRLIVGVEPIGETLLSDLILRLPDLAIVNGYGPTEACVFCTAYWVGREQHDRRTPIGVGIANMRAYLLDERLNRVGDGEDGEIFISGVALARGYLRRPAQTAERFLPDPYAGQPGARMYRSGDLGRALPDGNLVFVGRRDHQVKVRGHRIELGEVESVLASHEGVGEACVILRDNIADASQKDLFAYVVLTLGTKRTTAREIRQHLSEKLPTYMIPTTLMILNEMPRTPAGKIDRRMLPEPSREDYDLKEMAQPTTPTQELLCDIWREVLGVEQVGIDDSLFDLGAHSLSAIKIMARARETFQQELTPAHIFANPSVRELAQEIDLLKSESEKPPVICRVPRTGPLAVSFPQERVWYLESLAPGQVAYNTTITLRFKGPLRLDMLEATFTEIVRRHEMLRTTFRLQDNLPVQVIHPPWTVRLPIEDLSALSEEERAAAAKAAVLRNARTPFKLAELPLIRWALCKLAENDHLLIQVENHVVHDGWSFSVLIGEFKALYSAFCEGRPSPLPELEIQFGDFAVWQRQWMSGQVLEQQLDFWRHTLRDMPALLRLPSDFPRPRVMSFEGSSVRTDLSEEVYLKLRDFSRHHGVTLFMTMYAAFLALLHRYSGLTDIFVGSGVANRRFKEAEPLIGMMLNNIILRTDCSGNPSFAALLARARDVLVKAYAHQDAPFDKVVEALNPVRDPSYAAFTQVFFSFHDSAVPELALPGVEVELEMCQNESAKFDMNVVVIPKGEQLKGPKRTSGGNDMTIIWEFCTALYTHETIAQMLKHYIQILHQVVNSAQTTLSEFDLLDQSERACLLENWNPAPCDYPRHMSLAALFEETAARHSAEVALIFDREHLTYDELNARANRLARLLRARGVGPESRVGISLERSSRLIVGILAILKAGGAYVPLDPSYPAERYALIRKVAAVDLVITDSVLQEGLPSGAETPIFLDQCQAELTSQTATNLGLDLSPENLAYVMFTSGSTGVPKGVAVKQRGVVRLVRNNPYADFDENQVFFHFAPAAFDASTFEIWGALLNGASLVIMPPGPATVWSLTHTIREHSVTTIWLTSSLFNQFVDAGPEGLPALKQILAGGDVVSPAHVKRAMELLPGVKVINGYGPTECVTFSCCHPMHSAAEVGHPVSIGRSINHGSVYVLDNRLNLVPRGVYGELYIAGDGLARGYLDNPRATAEKFIPNPFAKVPGDRIYISGDTVRYRLCGSLEFLGRSDQQVKLRGHRIELGEIEAALNHHPAIRESVAVLHEEEGDKSIVAYIKPVRKGAVSVAEVRQFLKDKLAEYMVPSFFMFVDTLTLSVTGKINRKALPKPDRGRGNVTESFVAPRNTMERELAGIWQELLKQKQIGMRDNFFELGGHSLLATQLVSRVRATYGVHFPLISLLEEPTIDEMAVNLSRLIEAETAKGHEIVADTIQSVTAENDSDDLLAKMEEMSEEELNAALADMLEDEED